MMPIPSRVPKSRISSGLGRVQRGDSISFQAVLRQAPERRPRRAALIDFQEAVIDLLTGKGSVRGSVLPVVASCGRDLSTPITTSSLFLDGHRPVNEIGYRLTPGAGDTGRHWHHHKNRHHYLRCEAPRTHDSTLQARRHRLRNPPHGSPPERGVEILTCYRQVGRFSLVVSAAQAVAGTLRRGGRLLGPLRRIKPHRITRTHRIAIAPIAPAPA
jgi:hypothetical protein